MAETVSVSLVIAEEFRNPSGIAKIETILQSLGVTSTKAGYATISCKLTPTLFEKHFGVPVEKVPAVEAGEQDFGARAGYVAGAQPLIPPALGNYVTSVSVEPPVRRLNK